METIKPTISQKLNWALLAESALRNGKTDIAKHFLSMVTLAHDESIPLKDFQKLQEAYTTWSDYHVIIWPIRD